MPMNIESVVTGIKMTPAMINKYKVSCVFQYYTLISKKVKN